MIDPLAMPIGADPTMVTTTITTIREIHDEFGFNMCLGASNISFGLPNRHTLNAAFLPMANSAGPDERDHERALARVRDGRARERPADGQRPVGRQLDRAVPLGGCRGRGDGVGDVSVTDDTVVDEGAGHDGRGRVVLRFEPTGVETRVPPGVNLFDAASWNAVAIDSTCGGHGTCKKCKVRIVDGDLPISSLDVRAFTPTELRDGWRLACRAVATTDLSVDVPPMVTRPKAATVGVGRQVILRPSLQKRYLEMEDPTLEDQASDLERVLREIDDLDVTVSLDVLRDLGTTLREVRLQGHGRDLGRRADRRRARRHDRVAARHGVRPRHHDGRRHPARPEHRHAGRRRLDAEHAAAVRRRRDHARSRPR